MTASLRVALTVLNLASRERALLVSFTLTVLLPALVSVPRAVPMVTALLLPRRALRATVLLIDSVAVIRHRPLHVTLAAAPFLRLAVEAAL